MNCTIARVYIGPYLDGELAPTTRTDLETHARTCPACAAELKAQRTLFAELERYRVALPEHPPAALWTAIAGRLDASPPRKRSAGLLRLWRRPLAAAASLALLIGSGVFVAAWLHSSATPVQAEAVDYDLLLDNLSADVDVAVDRFLTHYRAEAIGVEQAAKLAPRLSFALPQELPGGYRLCQAYRMRFGRTPGIAARYRSNGDPLVVFFHPPTAQTPMGVHCDSPCAANCLNTRRVQHGGWRLVHYTDPSTCHCVLSKLDVHAQLPAVLTAIAPRLNECDKVRDP
ncbi:MAG: zf-HC2 domain-containing protein [Phycisphaerae bacterium]|nr:zf-HC2 domain-containing protein [Phycisphaerae bacterium]